MALKIILKPDERIFIGTAVITNSQKINIELVVHNDVPILRQKDIMTVERANTPCKMIYLTIQGLYIDPAHFEENKQHFFDIVKEVVQAAPMTTMYLVDIQRKIVEGSYYGALKICKKLIEYEDKLLNNNIN